MAYSVGGSSRSNWQVNGEHAEADDANIFLRNSLDKEHDDGANASERQAANEVAALVGLDDADPWVSSIVMLLQAAASPLVSDPEGQFSEDVLFWFSLYECRQMIGQGAIQEKKPSGGRARQAKKGTERQAATVDTTLSVERLGNALVDSSPHGCLTKDQLTDERKTALDAPGASGAAAVPASDPTEAGLDLKSVIASHTQEPSSPAPCAPPIEKKKRKPPKRKLVPDEIQSATELQPSPPSGDSATTLQSMQATDAQPAPSPGQPMFVASASLQPAGGNPRPPKRPRKRTPNSEESLEAATSQDTTDGVQAPSTSSSTLAPSTSRRRRPPHHAWTSCADSDDEDYEVPSSNRRRPANNTRSTHGAEDGTDEASSSSQASTPTPERRTTRQSAVRASERLHDTAQLLEEFERDATELAAYYAYNRIIEPVVRLDDISDASDNEFENNPELDCAIAASLEAPGRMVKQEREEATEETENSDCMKREHRCIICFDAPAEKPVACAHCKQFLGCRVCVKRWYRTTNISDLNRRSPLSRGQSHINHRSCPLCRIQWQEKPEVVQYCMLSRKAMKSEDTDEVKEEVKTEEGDSSSPEANSASPLVESSAGEPLSELSQFICTLILCHVAPV